MAAFDANPTPRTAHSLRGPVLTLLSGSSFALLLSYLSQPLLTRLYTPEAFGVMDAFVALSSVLFVASTLRYEDALLLPKEEAEARGLLRLCLLILLGMGVAWWAFSFWGAALIRHLGGDTLLPWMFWLTPTLWLMGSGRLAELWLMRREHFRTLSAGIALRTLSTTAVRLAAGILPIQSGAGGLIGGFLAGHLSVLLFYGWRLHRHGTRTAAETPPLRSLIRRYQRFPLFTLPAALLNALSMRLPFLLLLTFFDAYVLGLFGRAFMVLSVPLNLLSGATGQVFFARAAELRRQEQSLAPLTARVVRPLLQLGLYPTLLLIVLGPELFAFVFGEPWRQAGLYARWIAPWILLAGIASPMSRLFDVLERQRAELAASLLLFVLQTLALIVGGLQGNPAITLQLLGLTGLGGRAFQLGLLFRLARLPIRAALVPLGRYGLCSLPLVFALYYVADIVAPTWLFGLVVLSFSLYLALSMALDRYRPQPV